MLDWDELDAAAVERVVQMLLHDAYGATSIDGAGGDRAQDLRWDSPDGLVIFEVKSFRKRLEKSQRAQVKQSLLRAVELHSPSRWVLVTRSNPTPKELEWLASLASLVRPLVPEWLGRDWLDGRIAGREDLISYVEGAGYKLARRAQQFGLEQAALTTGDDLADRVAKLTARGDGLSPYWAWRFSTDAEGRQVRELIPRRPESAAVDPVTVSPSFWFPPDDPEAQKLAERLTGTLQLGGDVEIPSRFVTGFDVTATSPATQRLLGPRRTRPGNVRITSLPDTSGLPFTCSLRRKPSDDGEVDTEPLPIIFT